jgi:putative sigma-54 modulation protein
MEIQLFTRNMELTPRLQEYVEKKVSKLSRYLPNITDVRVDLSVENTRSSAQRQVAQLTIRTPRVMLRAEERASDMFTAIDAAWTRCGDRLPATRPGGRTAGSEWKEKKRNGKKRPLSSEEAISGKVVRVKRFEMFPMTPEEAIEQMELLGHQFFVFLNAEEGSINVVYRRRDGDYGLIIPELR